MPAVPPTTAYAGEIGRWYLSASKRIARAIRRLLAAYRELFEGGGTFADRLDAVEAGYADLPEIMEIVAFIREDGKRPLCLPGE